MTTQAKRMRMTRPEFDAGITTLGTELRGGPLSPTKTGLIRQEVQNLSGAQWKRVVELAIRRYSFVPTPEQIGELVSQVLEESAYRSQVQAQEDKKREEEFAKAPRIPCPPEVRERFPNLFKGAGLKSMGEAAGEDESGPVVDIGLTPAQVQMRCDENLRMLERMAEEERRKKAQ